MINEIDLNLDGKKYFSSVEDPLIPILLSKLYLSNKNIFFISKDDNHLNAIENFLSASIPNCNIISIPSWETLPYYISSPNPNIVSKRILSFTNLLNGNFTDKKVIILTTFNALSIKTAPIDFYKNLYLTLDINTKISINSLKSLLSKYGYKKVDIVREFGEFSHRGDILDIFTNGFEDPIRINFFDENIEKIVRFNPLSQRNIPSSDLKKIRIFSSKEYFLESNDLNVFKKKYRDYFDLDLKNDYFYNQIISGQSPEGLEYFLDLFHENSLSTIFDFILNNKTLSGLITTIASKDCLESLNVRDKEIKLNYKNRISEKESNYLEPNKVYLSFDHLRENLYQFNTIFLDDFNSKNNEVVNFKSKKLILNSLISSKKNIHDNNLQTFFVDQFSKYKSVLIFINDKTRLNNFVSFLEPVLISNDIKFHETKIEKFFQTKFENALYFINSNIAYSFEFNNSLFISESDVFGKSTQRRMNVKRKADKFLTDLNSLNYNDYIAHVDHGVGQYKALEIMNISGHKHDCLKIIYSDGDKLFVPVENINLLSKISDSHENRILDKLGSSSWLLKKEKIKKRINDIAEKLINTAANRNIHKFPSFSKPHDDYLDFVKGFPFVLTEDQETASNEVLDDIYSGKLMDRLICGDVGFGKTEIALRAAFIMVSNGKQVALVTPTTLLSEQHFSTFKTRFKNYNYVIKNLSRMTNNKDKFSTKQGLKNGEVDIVIGTHALLSKDVGFFDLGMIIIDEEQHFGVAQKERLKELQYNIHVLTLSATPIPRTLQLSLTGLKDLSLITTPPVNRLSVRTFVQNWDKLTLTDALNREKNRNGQTFVVCPKIRDIELLTKLVSEMSPNLKISIAHGGLKVSDLEKSINDFYKNKTDVLISTNIIESGIDIPNANTLIVYNSDLFGLSQLYQLRGRVGRSSTRAYAYFTTKKGKILTDKSKERLKVLKTLDNLGAGFSLASYDLDLRGAGNLLGDEQSGQIREIGYELYQKMLREAVLLLKNGDDQIIENWSPTINLGMPVLIPDNYVSDLITRMSLYRRAGDLKEKEEIREFLDELTERFGPPPNEVINLVFTIGLKAKCIKLNIDYVDVGPKAVLLGFKNNNFIHPEKLIEWISSSKQDVKIRKDEKIIINYDEKKENKINVLKKSIKCIENLI